MEAVGARAGTAAFGFIFPALAFAFTLALAGTLGASSLGGKGASSRSG
eukprot:CAMPEP_0180756474 /NCGR_PEP_ID=MMETSP1038_2-20121128/34251_1 /TAXON_ID=632150 /ORGANISM="Azadinium spinosum, Strain 3D9" /LENGTH=47 /DNA_ID= /DNA_START= /DNA_END= /DNA_ORIENTATION=